MVLRRDVKLFMISKTKIFESVVSGMIIVVLEFVEPGGIQIGPPGGQVMVGTVSCTVPSLFVLPARVGGKEDSAR